MTRVADSTRSQDMNKASRTRGKRLVLVVDDEKDLLDLQAEQLGETEGEWEARVELSLFDRVDRLSGHVDVLG